MSSPLLIDEHPLLVLPSLAQAVGLNEAIIVQQIHFWIDKKKKKPEKYAGSFVKGHWWVYNSIPEWQQQFPFWGDNTIRRALATLKELGVLVAEQLAEDPRDKTLWYRIDYDALNKITIAVPKLKGSAKKKWADASAQIGQMASTQIGQMQAPTLGDSSSTETSPEISQKIPQRSDSPSAAQADDWREIYRKGRAGFKDALGTASKKAQKGRPE